MKKGKTYWWSLTGPQASKARRVHGDTPSPRGLSLDFEDDALTMFPALNIDQNVAREGLDMLEECH